jgi:hypothetical protein
MRHVHAEISRLPDMLIDNTLRGDFVHVGSSRSGNFIQAVVTMNDEGPGSSQPGQRFPED